MNKIFKRVIYASILIHISILSYEILRMPFIKCPSYLTQSDISISRITQLKQILLHILKFILFYFVVQIIDLKSKYISIFAKGEEKNVKYFCAESTRSQIIDYSHVRTGDYKPNVHRAKNTPFKKEDIIAFFKLKNLRQFVFKYKAFISLYLFFLAANFQTLNPMLLVAYPFIAYWSFYWFFSWAKYAKLVLWPIADILLEVIYQERVKFLYAVPGDIQVIPNEIINFIENLGYEVKVWTIDTNFYNAAVNKSGKTVNLYVYGDIINIMTHNELLSVFFHEIGHVVNDSIFKGNFIKILLLCISYGIEFLATRKSETLIKTKAKSNFIHNIIMLVISIGIILVPLNSAGNNCYGIIDEINADKFSVKHSDREHLISSLQKICTGENSIVDMSLLYNYMYATHPCLTRRVEIIKDMKSN